MAIFVGDAKHSLKFEQRHKRGVSDSSRAEVYDSVVGCALNPTPDGNWAAATPRIPIPNPMLIDCCMVNSVQLL